MVDWMILKISNCNDSVKRWIIGLCQICCDYWNEQKHLELGRIMHKLKQNWRITVLESFNNKINSEVN